MTANRVDQASIDGAFRNHEARIKALEAVPPPFASGLPPWFSWTPTISFPASGVGSGTAPTNSTQFAWVMVQTLDGRQYPVGGEPLGSGTMLGAIKVTLTSAGSIAGGYNQIPELLLATSSDVVAYHPILDDATRPAHTIGTGWIRQASTDTVLHVELLATGELLVTNVPDLSDLSGAATTTANNTCRIANAGLSPAVPAFPWVWASGDQISVSYQSPIGADF